MYLNPAFFKDFLEILAENFPKLQQLCLTTELNHEHDGEWVEYAKICQAFASGKNIKLEIRGAPILCNFDDGIKCVGCGHYGVHPSKQMKIYNPK